MNSSSPQIAAGVLFVLGALIFVVAGFLYVGRAMWHWRAADAPNYLVWERGCVIASILATMLGFVLLEKMLETAGSMVLAPLAMATILSATVLIMAAESLFLRDEKWAYPTVVLYVVLAFLSQAAFGAALLQTGLLPAWIGWGTVLWNLAWLIILPLRRPQDIYYPWLHHVAPLFIGISLLIMG